MGRARRAGDRVKFRQYFYRTGEPSAPYFYTIRSNAFVFPSFPSLNISPRGQSLAKVPTSFPPLKPLV